MSNFLSGMAIVLSLLMSLFSAFTAYRVFNLEKQVGALSQSTATQQTTGGTNAASNPLPQTIPSPIESPSSPPAVNTAGIQPGQFIQPAFENKAQVELLTVKRIQDPETGTRDVVNVQFRVRRMGRAGAKSGMVPSNTTARNPDTGETYDSYRRAGIKADKRPSEDRATPLILLLTVKEGASVDAYVWMKIPEGVNTVDIYIPETQAFRNVPISS
jgi:hypothetical protein